MNLKKTLALLLALTMVLAMVACAPTTPPSGDDTGNTPGGDTGEIPGGDSGETPGGDTGNEGGTEPDPEPTPTLTLTPSSPYANVGDRLHFYVSGEGYDAEALTFTVSDPSILSPAGQVGSNYAGKAVKTGELTVTATSGELSASCTITVLPDEYVAKANDPLIRYLGRTELQNDGRMLINNTAAGFEVKFYGTSITLKMWDQPTLLGSIYAVFLDGERDPEAYKIDLRKDLAANGTITVASFDEPGVHTLRVQKVTEEQCSNSKLIEISVEGGALVPYEPEYTFKMEVYGDSIEAGFGNIREIGSPDSHYPQNGLLSFSAVAATALNAEYRAMVQSGISLYTNEWGYHLSERYDQVTPLTPTKWDMSSWVPDLVLIDLGSNDLNVTGPTGHGDMPMVDALYKERLLKFVKDLYTAYGEDTVFILCSGVGPLTQGRLTPLVAEVAAQLCAEGISVYTYVLPAHIAEVPGNGHPYVHEHEEAAYGLINTICEALNIKNPFM